MRASVARVIRRHALLLSAILFFAVVAQAAPTVDYQLSLARRLEHLLGVRVHLPPGPAERDLQLPVWNGLYQVRDFAQYVRNVKATSPAAQPLSLRKLDTSTWHISGAQDGADLEYETYIDLPGAFGAQLNADHAFLNLAEVLMYAVDARASPVTLSFTAVPAIWTVATALPSSASSLSANTYSARDYDHLVDSPVEIANFAQTFLRQGGATYRVVVHADAQDFDLQNIARTLREVVASEVEWIGDRPFDEYLFIIHLPRGVVGGGGMEHAYSSALEVGADLFRDEPVAFTGLAAHEFFHVWNVKRIRPQSLEPVDYTRENYTDSLWFAEGVTDTVAYYTLLRIGALGESQWLRYLARWIRELEQRPARLTQSLEDSSVDTWLEKYPEYLLPERSISYYKKGLLLGVLLDLAIRDSTQGRKSLRDLFQWLNRNYAQKHRFYADSEDLRQAVEAVTGADFHEFFDRYIGGVAELPYDHYLRTVGLRLERHKAALPDPGFVSVRNFDGAPVVVRVDAQSAAARRGLRPGDSILKINGKPVSSDVTSWLETMRVGETLKLRVTGPAGQRDIKFKLPPRQRDDYRIVNLDQVTPEQRARRAAWLNAEDQGAGAAPGAVRAEVPR